MEKVLNDEEMIAGFHAMWDNFPEMVMLLAEDREIIAINKAAEKFGVQAGIKCFSIGTPDMHKGCLFNKAVKNEPVFITDEGKFGKAYGYWIPVAGKPEWMVHFGVGSMFEYPHR